MPRTLSMVEMELEEARQECLRAMQDGAELTLRYEEVIAVKDAELCRLRSGRDEAPYDFDDPDNLRLSLLVWRMIFSLCFFLALLHTDKKMVPLLKLELFVFSLWPLAAHWIGGKNRAFMRREHWRGFRDNDVYRRIRVDWNKLTDRIKLQ